MGTYTANKNLYMPTVGEQGWGDLMNTNLSTIDNFLKPITVSGSTYTFTGNQTGGTITATKITNSGTLTQTGTSTFTGKITANGGIGTKALSATSITNSGTLTQTGTSTFTGKITANGGVNDYEERITALENGEFPNGIQHLMVIPSSTGMITLLSDKSVHGANKSTVTSPLYTLSSESNFFIFPENYETTYTFTCTDWQSDKYPCYAKLYINGTLVHDIKNTSVTGTIRSGDTYQFSAQSINAITVGASLAFADKYI